VVTLPSIETSMKRTKCNVQESCLNMIGHSRQEPEKAEKGHCVINHWRVILDIWTKQGISNLISTRSTLPAHPIRQQTDPGDHHHHDLEAI